MDRNSDVALMHNLYYNYENLGGLTGQWEPENTDDDSNASSSSPSPCEFKKPRSDSISSSNSRSNKKDSNENFTNGRTSICDNPESPTFPRFPDLVEDLVGSPLKIPSSVMKSTDETLETTEASEEDKRRVEEKDEEEKKEEVEESSTGNGEGVRWVFNTPYFYPNGTGSPLYGSDYDDSDNSILSVSSAGSVKRKNKQNNNRVDKDNKDLRKLLGLDKKKPAKKQTRNKATHSEIKKLLTSPSFGSAVSGMISLPCPENAVGLLSALANKTVANISNGGLNMPMSPFGNCATPGSTPGATPDTNEGSNRKGRRKNIKNSRQLSQMNSVKNSPVFPGMNLLSPVISPKKKSPGLPKINLTGSPIVIAPDQQQQQRYNNTSSPEQDPASPIYHAEHSTFDCAVCKQSVCKLLGNNRSHGVVDHEDSSIDSSCHICEYCNMAFPSGQKLKSHLRCHIKPFPCTVCNKSFTNSGNLKKHMRTHTGEKPYKCPLCDAAWANPSNLKRHMLKHDIHKCSSCKKDFPNSCTMSVVTERITGNRLYVCQNCLTDNGQKYLKGKQQNRPFP